MPASATIDLEELRNAADAACRLLKTLSNPDRLLLLCRLSQGEACVGELESELGIVQPTLSQQLGVLRDEALAIARKQGWQFEILSTSFFLSRRALKPAAHSGMPVWQDRLFIGLAKSASDATDFFQIPTGRVVEVGTQVTI